MDIVTFSKARASLKEVMDRVADDKTPVVITRRDAEDMVLVSLSEWNSIQETLHLLSSPRNAERLLENEPDMVPRRLRLIEDCRRNPFRGVGKPEPLRNELSGWWSRRIDREHRLVYRVVGSGDTQTLQIAQCRYHY
jgi:toxin YoeB